MKCCVKNCSNNWNLYNDLSFYSFPKNKKLKAVWIKELGLSKALTNDRVCSYHFHNEDFYWLNTNIKTLKCQAIPMSVSKRDSYFEIEACRICLAANRKLLDVDKCCDRELLNYAIGCEITDINNLPFKICWECAHHLATFAKFRQNSSRVQRDLQNIVGADKFVSLRDLKSIKRLHRTLSSNVFDENYTNISNVIHDEESVTIDNNIDEIIINNDDVNDETEVKDEIFSQDINLMVADDEIKKELDCDNGTDSYLNDSCDDHFNDSDEEKLSDYKIKSEENSFCLKRISKNNVSKINKENTGIRKKRSRIKSPKEEIKIDKRKKGKCLNENLFIITYPTYEEQIEEVQKRTEDDRYKKATYKCEVCFRGFYEKIRYKTHVDKHSEKYGRFECFICKSRCKSSQSLRKHLTANHKEDIRCTMCSFRTKNRSVAYVHENWHSGTMYKCPHCDCVFDKHPTFKGHLRIKHPCDFVCELCGYAFLTSKGVEVHKYKKHTVDDLKLPIEGPECEECNVRFLSEKAYSRHLNLSSKHSKVDDPNRIRNDSQQPSEKSMRNIERRVNINPNAKRVVDSGPIPCEQCGEEIANAKLYTQHFRRLHPDKNRTKYPSMKAPCMCELCGQLFHTMAFLKVHMAKHAGAAPFRCAVCAKAFASKYALAAHEAQHREPRARHECAVCGKRFSFRNNQLRHMLIHTGLKPHKCDVCGKCFTTRGEEKSHTAHVHLRKPWPKRDRNAQ